MVEGNRDSTVGLVFGAAALALLYFLGAALRRSVDFDGFFGVEAYRAAGIGVFLLAFGLLLVLLLVPGLARGVARVLGGAVDAIPARIRLPLLLAASALAFWLLPTFKLSGDAVPVILRTTLGDVYASNPLTSFLSIAISRALSWPAVPAIRLLSCASGVLFVYSAVKLARECFPAGPARGGFAAVVLTCGTSALYFGSIEVYAPLAAFLGLYLYLGVRSIRRDGSALLPALALGVAFSLHGSAGLLLPSLGYLANGCRVRPLRPVKILTAGAIFLLPVAVVFGALYAVHWGGQAPAAAAERFGSFLGGNEQGPLLPLLLTPTNVLHRYAIFDAEHLVGVLNLIVLASPVGVLLLLLGRKPAGDSPAFRFASAAALFLVAFPIFWNVNYPLRQDWDLFSPMGIPIAVMGGLAYFSRGAGPRRAVGSAALALFAFVPLVLANRGDHYDRRLCVKDFYAATVNLDSMLPEDASARREINLRARDQYRNEIAAYDPFGAEADTDRGMKLLGASDSAGAERLLGRVLEKEPRNARAAEGLGAALLGKPSVHGARAGFLIALQQEPWRLPSRMNLARIALAEGNEDEAIRQLENGLRRGGMHPFAGQALLELAALRSRRGDTDIAAKLRDLAAAKGATPAGVSGGGSQTPR